MSISCSTSIPTWTKDGQSLPGDVVTDKKELYIHQVTLQHAGTYTCTSTLDKELSIGSSTLYVGGNDLVLMNMYIIVFFYCEDYYLLCRSYSQLLKALTLHRVSQIHDIHKSHKSLYTVFFQTSNYSLISECGLFAIH